MIVASQEKNNTLSFVCIQEDSLQNKVADIAALGMGLTMLGIRLDRMKGDKVVGTIEVVKDFELEE